MRRTSKTGKKEVCVEMFVKICIMYTIQNWNGDFFKVMPITIITNKCTEILWTRRLLKTLELLIGWCKVTTWWISDAQCRMDVVRNISACLVHEDQRLEV